METQRQKERITMQKNSQLLSICSIILFFWCESNYELQVRVEALSIPNVNFLSSSSLSTQRKQRTIQSYTTDYSVWPSSPRSKLFQSKTDVTASNETISDLMSPPSGRSVLADLEDNESIVASSQQSSNRLNDLSSETPPELESYTMTSQSTGTERRTQNCETVANQTIESMILHESNASTVGENVNAKTRVDDSTLTTKLPTLIDEYLEVGVNQSMNKAQSSEGINDTNRLAVVPPALRLEYERLQKEIDAEKEKIDDLVARIEVLEDEKEKKDGELQRYRSDWEDEKDRLMAMFTNRTALLQEQTEMERSLQEARESRAEILEKQSRLEDEVADLENQIDKTQSLIRFEKQKVAALQEANMEIEEALQAEQDKYEKERKQMTEQLVNSRMATGGFQAQADNNRTRWTEEMNQLQKDLEDVRLMESDLKKLVRKSRYEHNQGQGVLQDKINDAKLKVEEVQQQLDAQMANATQVKNDLGAQALLIQEIIQGTQKDIKAVKDECQSFLQTYDENYRAQEEKKSILSSQISQQQDTYNSQQLEMNTIYQVKRSETYRLEEELITSREERQEQRNQSETAVADASQSIRHTLETGKKRFDGLRTFFHTRIEGVKRKGRQKKKELVVLYEDELGLANEKMELQRQEWEEVDQIQQELQRRVEGLLEEGKKFDHEWEVLEHGKYIPDLARANARLMELQDEYSTTLNYSRRRQTQIDVLENSYKAIYECAKILTLKRYQNLRSRFQSLRKEV